MAAVGLTCEAEVPAKGDIRVGTPSETFDGTVRDGRVEPDLSGSAALPRFTAGAFAAVAELTSAGELKI